MRVCEGVNPSRYPTAFVFRSQLSPIALMRRWRLKASMILREAATKLDAARSRHENGNRSSKAKRLRSQWEAVFVRPTREWSLIIAVSIYCATWLISHDWWTYREHGYVRNNVTVQWMSRTHQLTGRVEVLRVPLPPSSNEPSRWVGTESEAERSD